MVVISIHNLIANDPKLAPRNLIAKEQAITHFEDMFRLLGYDKMQVFQRRWNTFPFSLKIREYHSPQRIRETLNRTPMYMKALQIFKVNWIGLKLSPPLLLRIYKGRKE